MKSSLPCACFLLLCLAVVVLSQQATFSNPMPSVTPTGPMPEPKSLLVGSFNMWIWGQSKLKKTNITDVIIDIILRYDLIALQEIRDVSNFSANELKRMVQAKNPDYEFVASDHLGRTSSKEQYSFFYKKSKIIQTEQWQYPDKEDYFERPPFFMRFKTSVDYPYGAFDIAFANVHTKPETTVYELGNMTRVYDDVFAKWQPAVTLFGGDMNADCSYVPKSKWSTIPFWTNSTFVWLIDNNTDTTSSNSHCAYDRFVAVGQKLVVSLIPNTAKAWNYWEDMGFTREEAKTVSDHIPIEFRFYSNWFYPMTG